MQRFYIFLVLAVTITLIVLLDRPMGAIPPIGKFISPQQGFWQNAEPADQDFSVHLQNQRLQAPVDVYFDERLVPHVFAQHESDAYFVQGYLHARFRLWQMEFQTHAAAGRLAEVLGAGPDSAFLNNDRMMRRMGMVFGAQHSLKEIENDPATRMQLDAYTAGVNQYIEQLTYANLPLEYRLLNYFPEKWSNLKTALFLKYMSYDLTGYDTDIEYTHARSFFSEADFNRLYPIIADSLDPVIPKTTAFAPPAIVPEPPLQADSLYYQWKDSTVFHPSRPDRSNGSNNWVLGGGKTASGKPILCNDPHLGLNLPALWYEMHIHTPFSNTYGVSFPGAPAIIIGFNDSIAWGVTNAARDVKDYYRIEFKDAFRSEYRFNNSWKKAELKIETYSVKGGADFYDTVAYTVFGPVMYDDQFNGKGRSAGDQLALRWKAHDPSNELKTFYLLNRARNYQDFEAAIRDFVCPGQNFAFASKSGDIALWHQGQFPAKWYRQGDFIMPGTDSTFAWQGHIPQQENPHQVNPERGFVSSANQMPADTSYPYYLGGSYDVYRGLLINRLLSAAQGAGPADMQRLQLNNYNVFAETALPLLLGKLRQQDLNAEEKKFFDIISNWNWLNDSDEKGATIFEVWFDALEQAIWSDELQQQTQPFLLPQPYTLIDALKRDSSFIFIDNILTPERESLYDVVTESFRKAVTTLSFAEKDKQLDWGKYKDAGIRHLLRLAPLSRFHLNTGGGVNIINATKQFHGPSWRMVVHLDADTEAYGVFPGGQSGNPGSRYYDAFVDDWVKGNYYRLWVMKKEEGTGPGIRSVMHFSK